MAGIKEIRTHIHSVEETLKITNAMYLISSSNLRKARAQLTQVEPYFQKIRTTIADILLHSPEIHHRYFDRRPEKPEHRVGYLVISGDKGLAGAYNHNILKLAEEQLAKTPNFRLFVMGKVGESYFAEKDMLTDPDFQYQVQNPTLNRAREMAGTVVDLFLTGELDEVCVVVTNMVTSFRLEPTVWKLLPLEAESFPPVQRAEGHCPGDVVYLPSVQSVMDHLVPGYLKGVLFGAMVESYCSEQNARMMAMKSSNDNARKLLQELQLTYNRARQAAITQEITEVVGGAQAAL